jgi:hypothetical protein
MNFLEIIGLLTIIGIAIFVLGRHQEAKDELRKHEEGLSTVAMYIAYRLAIRQLYQRHQEPNIREALKKAAEHIYGGVSTVALEISDEQYLKSIKVDFASIQACQRAETSIRERGYPLAIEDGKIINRWGHTGHEVVG